MTEKRVASLFMAFIFLFSVVLGRCYITASNSRYGQAAQNQTVVTLDVAKTRGNFYDRLNRPLTGYGTSYRALCLPEEGSYAQLFDLVSENSQNILYQRRNSSTPFLLPVQKDLTGQGIYTCTTPGRYWACPPAGHLLGYLNGKGQGISGLEKTFDSLLAQSGDSYVLQCGTTASGLLMEGEEPVLSVIEGNHLGVRLTLDLPLQRACEAIAQVMMESGCILVMECTTGKVLATVSTPGFDPSSPENSFQGEDGALLNRVLCQYNVGSVFKPVLAACALERSPWKVYELYTCEGYEEVDGQVYRCAGGVPHGEITMAEALAQSCNCYFIRLGAWLGGEHILDFCKKMGLGEGLNDSGYISGAQGHLPDPQTLKNTGQLANFSFGQGELLATPLQMAAVINSIADGGEYIAPAFLEAIIDQDTLAVEEKLYQKESHTVLKEETAGLLRNMLVKVVEEGTGTQAAPLEEGAGGKTGTAQTGSYAADGNERMNFWFAGFYPAQKPEFTIVVLQDYQTAPLNSSAAVFSQVCNALKDLQIC